MTDVLTVELVALDDELASNPDSALVLADATNVAAADGKEVVEGELDVGSDNVVSAFEGLMDLVNPKDEKEEYNE
jgi:hypothetical protein